MLIGLGGSSSVAPACVPSNTQSVEMSTTSASPAASTTLRVAPTYASHAKRRCVVSISGSLRIAQCTSASGRNSATLRATASRSVTSTFAWDGQARTAPWRSNTARRWEPTKPFAPSARSYATSRVLRTASGTCSAAISAPTFGARERSESSDHRAEGDRHRDRGGLREDRAERGVLGDVADQAGRRSCRSRRRRRRASRRRPRARSAAATRRRAAAAGRTCSRRARRPSRRARRCRPRGWRARAAPGATIPNAGGDPEARAPPPPRPRPHVVRDRPGDRDQQAGGGRHERRERAGGDDRGEDVAHRPGHAAAGTRRTTESVSPVT